MPGQDIRFVIPTSLANVRISYVEYTGNGTTPRNINHNLGDIPDLCVIVKKDSGFLAVQRFSGFTGNISQYYNGTLVPGSQGIRGLSATQVTIGSDLNVNQNNSVFCMICFKAGT